MQMLTNEPLGGITSGLEDNESVQALSNVTSGIETLFQNIDEADNPKEIMDAIRGDEASVEQRRMELAQLVGEQDAKQTPESVLTIVQPLMTVIESTGGIADLDTEIPVAPNISDAQQMEAMARMQSGQQPVMLKDGSVDAVKGNPTGNPDMNLSPLQILLQRGGMFGQTDPIKGIQMAQRLVPMPKREDFTGMFTDKPSAYQDYKDILPYNVLTNIGQSIMRTPTLFGALTSPEVTSQLDPLMKVALLQSKEKAEREEKEASAFTEAKKDAQKSRLELYKPLITSIGTPDIELFKSDDGSQFIVNKKTGNYERLTPGKTKVEYFSGMGIATIKPDGTYTIKDVDMQVIEDPNTGQKILFNPITKQMGQTIVEGQVKYEKFGSDEFGYYSLNPYTNQIMQLVEGKVPLSEAQKLIKQFAETKQALTKRDISGPEKQNLLNTLEALSPKIFGQDTEFQKIVNEMTDNFRKDLLADAEAGVNELDINDQVREFKQNLLLKYFDAKTVSQSRYDPYADEKSRFNQLLTKQIEKRNGAVATNDKMATLANQAQSLSTQFQTGLFAPQRLFLGRLLQQFPAMETYMRANTDPAMFNQFFGGGIASAEALNSVSTQFALAFAQYLPGNLNTEEIRMIQTAAPSLTTTKEGITLLQKIFTGQNERLKKEQAESIKILASEDAKKLTGRELYLYHERKMREFKDNNPIFSQQDIDALPSTDVLPPKYFARDENRVNLPATEMNQVLAAISKEYRNRRDFDTFAVPKIKDHLKNEYKIKMGVVGDIDQFLDPSTDKGRNRLNLLYDMGNLNLMSR